MAVDREVAAAGPRGAALRILGIDPGTVVVGIACLEVATPGGDRAARVAAVADGRPLAHRARNVAALGAAASARPILVEAFAARLGRSDPVEARLARLADTLEDAFERLRPDELALEEAFAGKSVQSALRIGEARGVVLALARRHGVGVHQYPPARIKRCVTGHGGASKEVVARMVDSTLGVRVDGPADVTDACAVALCRVEARRAPHLDA